MYSMVDIEINKVCPIKDNDIECYICTSNSPIPWKSDCDCTDRYIHRECLVELIDKTGNLKCPVCLVDYRNINSTFYRKFYINSKAVWTFIFYFLSSSVFICGVYILSSFKNTNNHRDKVVLGVSGVAFVTISSMCYILLILFIKQEGGFKKLYLDSYVPHIKLEINEPNLCA